MKASHQKHTVMVGNQPVVLEPGQFVCGRESAARETGLTPQNIRSCFQTLRLMENLTIKTTNKFSLITVLNWDTYQNGKEISTNKSTNNQPTNNQQITTNNNVKKGKKDIPTHFLDFSKRFQEYQKEQFGDKIISTDEKTIIDGANALDKLCRIDSFDFERDVKPALFWAVKNDFWSKQIRSLGRVRDKSKNGEMKFKNLFTSFKCNKPKKQPDIIY